MTESNAYAAIAISALIGLFVPIKQGVDSEKNLYTVILAISFNILVWTTYGICMNSSGMISIGFIIGCFIMSTLAFAPICFFVALLSYATVALFVKPYSIGFYIIYTVIVAAFIAMFFIA